MRVRLLLGMSGPEVNYRPGEVIELDAITADRMARSGACVILCEEQEHIDAETASAGLDQEQQPAIKRRRKPRAKK